MGDLTVDRGKIFSKRLKTLYLQRAVTYISQKGSRYTQTLFAREISDFAGIKVDQQHIHEYLNNGTIPRTDLLCSIADFFNVSLDYLLGRDDYLTKNDLKATNPNEMKYRIADEIENDLHDKIVETINASLSDNLYPLAKDITDMVLNSALNH